MRARTAAAAVAALAALALTGCSAATEEWNDAPIDKKYDHGAEVYSMPDGFANVASKCDVHGNRMYTTRGGGKGGGKAVTVIPDASCAEFDKDPR